MRAVIAEEKGSYCLENFLTCIPGHWVGRDEPIPYAPRSPDITPLGFFL